MNASAQVDLNLQQDRTRGSRAAGPAATVYRYPPSFIRITTALWVLVISANLIEYSLAIARSVYTSLYGPLQLPDIALLQMPQSILMTIFTAHLGLLMAILAARALAYLVPGISIGGDGLMIHTAIGSKRIPYRAVRGIRSTELGPNGRFIVWVDSAQGLPLQGLLASLLFGRRLGSGVLLTSDIAGFDRIIATLVDQLKRNYGEEKFTARFIEEQPTRLVEMIYAPRATIHNLTTEETLPITQREAVIQAGLISLALALPLLIGAFIHLVFPWGAVVITLISLGEFPLVALYLTVIPIDSMHRMEFTTALRIYPLTQISRCLAVLVLTLLIIAGVPSLILVWVPIPAIALGISGVIILTEEWFEVRSPESWLGALVTVIYQLVLYELFVALVPR